MKAVDWDDYYSTLYTPCIIAHISVIKTRYYLTRTAIRSVVPAGSARHELREFYLAFMREHIVLCSL